jgi:hypothetical protein
MTTLTRARRFIPGRPCSSACRDIALALGCALALVLIGPSPAQAQSSSQLRCRGVLFGAPAAIEGQRLYAAYNALGDGQVRFNGTVTARGMSGRIAYGGYTATGAFQGIMSGPLGSMQIAVLDNTGGRMLIYNGRPTLKAPDTIGEFICAWG